MTTAHSHLTDIRATDALPDCYAAVAAIAFALQVEHEDGSGMDYLRCWNEGDFDACRREWPEAPDECYVGADPLYKPAEVANVEATT